MPGRLSLVHQLSTQVSAINLQRQQLRIRNRQDVLIEHDHVSELSRLERPLDILLPGKVGPVCRVHSNGFGPRDAFFRVAMLYAVGTSPGCCEVQPDTRVDGQVVRAERHEYAKLLYRSRD